MTQKQFNSGLLSFLQQSPTPFHCAQNMATYLVDAGFSRLDEADAWELEPGKRYFVTRNDSSIIAFNHAKSPVTTAGMRMIGAHTDSPCLKIKPNPETTRHGYVQLGVEVYGGVLLNPWFDRDLSIAGRVTGRTRKGEVVSELIDLQRAVATVPSLAIHLDRDANNERSINAQRHIPPVLCLDSGKSDFNLRKLLEQSLKKQRSRIHTVLDYELCLYDVQAPALIGLEEDFIASARLDNLLSCYAGLWAITQAGSKQHNLLICTDHEEVGSASACGAQGPFLRSVLERITGSSEDYTRTVDQSMMVSADNAHAIHPNFADKHDPQHAPRINAGPVIKVNANQRYATNSETSALFRQLCKEAKVSVQSMVARTDMGCGSTIGPISATEVGVATVDVGVPQLAMHSCRELAGSQDSWQMARVMKLFCQRGHLW